MQFEIKVKRINPKITITTEKTVLLSVVRSTTIKAGPKETANKNRKACQLSSRVMSFTSSYGVDGAVRN